jgi:hypothetical protein
MISIVIPYLQQLSESKDDELRLALRSWCKYAMFDFNIILVGDKPNWYTGDHIATTPIRGRQYTRAYDIANKIRHIVGSEIITDHFIYSYDDIYAIAPVKREYFDLIVAESHMASATYLGSGKWNELLERTYKAVTLDQMYNYETHLPRMFNKKRLENIYNAYELEVNPLLFSTLYYNEYFKEPDIVMNKSNEIKAFLPGKCTREQIIDKCKGKIFLNNTNVAWNNSLSAYLKNLFPEKCRFEK